MLDLSTNPHISLTPAPSKKHEVLNVPDVFLNLQYETNLQKRRQSIDKFLTTLQKFHASHKLIALTENSKKHIDSAFSLASQLLEESNLTFYGPALKIGLLFFKTLPTDFLHPLQIKQFISNMVLKFNNKQTLNQTLKSSFEVLLKRGFLPVETMLLSALEQVSKSKFLKITLSISDISTSLFRTVFLKLYKSSMLIP